MSFSSYESPYFLLKKGIKEEKLNYPYIVSQLGYIHNNYGIERLRTMKRKGLPEKQGLYDPQLRARRMRNGIRGEYQGPQIA